MKATKNFRWSEEGVPFIPQRGRANAPDGPGQRAATQVGCLQRKSLPARPEASFRGRSEAAGEPGPNLPILFSSFFDLLNIFRRKKRRV